MDPKYTFGGPCVDKLKAFSFFFFPQLKSNIMCSQDILMAFWDLTLLFFILKVSSKGMTLVQYFILSRFQFHHLKRRVEELNEIPIVLKLNT